MGHTPKFITYFVAQLVIQVWLLGALSGCHLCPGDIAPSFGFWALPSFLAVKRCSRLILCISWPSIRIGHFSREPGVFLLETSIRNWALSEMCALEGCGAIVSTFLQQIELESMCMYVNLCVHTYLYLFL